MNMKKYILLGFAILICVSAIFYLKWDWVITHGDLAAGFLTSGFLILALIGALFTLRAMRHDRTTSIALELRQDYESGVVFEGRKLVLKIRERQKSLGIQDKKGSFLDTIEHYRLNYPEEFMELTSIPALFDLIGWLVREKCCDAKAIDEQIDWKFHYTMWEPYIRHSQHKRPGEPLDDKATAFYGNFVWLYNELLSRQ